MLTQQDNELLTHTGPGTPMGDVFRRFWQPALLSSELPAPDCDPIRLRLLGENLVAYRDTNGDVGVMDFYCPHRRAGMFFGRNEECGLRCVYHGWKFDKDGNCTDMPSEPAESNFKDKVKITAYPAEEAGDVVWIYMGPAETKPALPDFEWTKVPSENRVVTRWIQQSNYMQAAEGEIDTSHVSFNHRWFNMKNAPDSVKSLPRRENKNGKQLNLMDGAPHLTVNETNYGFTYGSRRAVEDEGYYWRITQYLLPMYSLIPSPDWPRGGRGWVPIDDENISVIQYSYNAERPFTDLEREHRSSSPEGLQYGKFTLDDGYIIDIWIPARLPENDYLIDREMQRKDNYTGIASGREQDMAMTDTMGAIADRTKEHLGTSDTAIIAARRILLKIARDLQEGTEPYAPQHPGVFAVRAIDVVDHEGDFDKLMAEHSALSKTEF